MICPHCQKEGVSLLAVSTSGIANPARCRECNGAVSINSSAGWFAAGLFALASTLSPLVAFVYWSFLPLLALVPAYFAIHALAATVAPIRGVDECEVRRGKHWAIALLVGIALTIVFVGLLDAGSL